MCLQIAWPRNNSEFYASLENFIRFEKYKRCTKRKCFVIWVASHFTYNIVMCKRVKLNSYEPLVRDKNMKFVTHNWYNNIFHFGTPFEFLKRCMYNFFQWKDLATKARDTIESLRTHQIAWARCARPIACFLWSAPSLQTQMTHHESMYRCVDIYDNY